MPSLKCFSLFESKIETVNFTAFPHTILLDSCRIEIDRRGKIHAIDCDKEVVLNAMPCKNATIRTNDLITFENEFLIFNAENSASGSNTFIGKVRNRQSQDRILIFKLPKKLSKRAFADIEKKISAYPEIKHSYIDSSEIQYMDSESISTMLDLIGQAGEKGHKLFFYRPSYKFDTYMKLANIEKRVAVKPGNEEAINRFIDSRTPDDSTRNRYMISGNNQQAQQAIINPEAVISLGRLNNACDMVFSSESISRIHALFVNCNNSLYIIDCRSTNHTFVNGWKIEPYVLHHLKVNDIIALGNDVHFKVKQI